MTRIIRPVLLVLVMLVVAACIVTFAASALPDEPVELQPIIHLMVDDLEMAYVYELDGGLVIIRGTTIVYTCGCKECVTDTVVSKTPAPPLMCQYDDGILASDPRCDFCTIFPGGGTWNGIAVDCETVPTKEPTQEPTQEPTEEPKVKCNRGLGNGSEDCDPGNSGGKPGKAGEDNE